MGKAPTASASAATRKGANRPASQGDGDKKASAAVGSTKTDVRDPATRTVRGGNDGVSGGGGESGALGASEGQS